MTPFHLTGDALWERMERAVQKVQERLERTVSTLEQAGIPYAIIGGNAVKGPAAKMYSELGIEPSPLAVANHYRGLLSGFVLDTVDAQFAAKIDVPTLVVDTLMRDGAGRARLARDVLQFTRSL